MTKRTAMLMAAGVVAALFAGSVALAFGLSGNTAASATSSRPDPIVRTVHRTVRVEKDAKPADQPVEVITIDSGSAPAATSSQDSLEDDSDDAYEDSDDAYEDESDDRYEDEDHESDDDSSGEHESDNGDDD